MPLAQFGSGSRGSGFGSSLPPVVRALLFANVGLFLVMMLFGGMRFSGVPLDTLMVYFLALHPPDSPAFYIWQPITYMFMHGGLSHVLINMLILWMFGNELEEQWGSKKFLTYYLICGLAGAAAHILIAPVLGIEPAPLVGASGAIFGLLAAFGLLNPDRYVYFYFLFPIKAKYFVAGYLALEMYILWTGSPDGISHLAHLGGAFAGVIYLVADIGLPQLMARISGRRTRSYNGFDEDEEDRPNFWGGDDSSKRNQDDRGFFKRRGQSEEEPVDAEYYDVKPRSSGNAGAETQTGGSARGTTATRRVVTQEEVDRILDKIAATGYQNLTEEERAILFEASRKMDERR